MPFRRLSLILGALFALAPAGLAQKAGSFSGLTSWMEEFLSRHEIPGGAIAITQGGRLVYAQGFGLANPGTSENFQPDTLTRVGGLSALVTSATLLRLADRGGVDLQARAFGPSGVLPFPVPAEADTRVSDIRLRDFFTMASGWPAASDSSAPGTALDILAKTGSPLPGDRDRLLEAMLVRPLTANPGTTYDYANINPLFLAKMISLKSEKTYEDQVAESLLKPAGLLAPRVGATRLAERQIGEAVYDGGESRFPSLYPGEGLVPPPYAYGSPDLALMAPADGWLFSAVDFAMLLGHLGGERKPALLSAGSRTLFATKPAGVDTWQTTANFYGFHTEAFENGSLWGKCGSMPGATAWAASLPEGLGVVIVLNGRDQSTPEVFDPPFAGTTFDQEIRDGIQNALKDLPRVSGDLFRSRYQPGRPALLGTALAAGTVGVAFSHQLSTVPKNAAISTTGNIPGLRINPLTGELRGTPKEPGRFLLPITATNVQGSAEGLLEVLIAEPGTPVVSGDAFCPEKFQNVVRDGRVVDEIVMLGANLTVRPRDGIGARVIFLDADGDLVVAEMSGPGTLTIELENAVLRANARFPARGDAAFTLKDTSTETTFRLYAVGKINGPYPASGDAVATARRVTITAPALGHLALGNSRFLASTDAAGIVAPDTSVDSAVIGEIDAEASAVPSLLFGQTRQVVFSGSKLAPSNGQPIQIAGITAVETFFGADANGQVFAEQRPSAKFLDHGKDVTPTLFPPQ